jgi:hypothetical protein
MFAMVPAMTRMANRGLRTSDRSTSGHLTRCSTTTNAASAASEQPNAITVGADSQPQAGVRSNANVNKPIPTVISASPAMSMRRGTDSSKDSVMQREPIASTPSVSGTFSQKIHRQPTVSVSRPPISGPAALPNPAMP